MQRLRSLLLLLTDKHSVPALVAYISVLLLLTISSFFAVTMILSRSPQAHADPHKLQVADSMELQALDQVTDAAYGTDGNYVPNSWGVHKTRFVRTSTDDLFTFYIDAGSGPDAHHHHVWHLMHKAPGSQWQEIQNGDGGQEPINILRGPHDEIHVLAWPATNGVLEDIETTDLGKTFTVTKVPGDWIKDQGYAGATINTLGNIVVFQTGDDQPGMLYWAFYNAGAKSWKFHTSQLDTYRFTYNIAFLSDSNDLSLVGMRDVLREELGYPTADHFDYIFNRVSFFELGNVDTPQVKQTVIATVEPRNNNDADVAYVSDAYVDTKGRMHVLYSNQYEGVHHAILENGQVTKDVLLKAIPNLNDPNNKARIIQDTQGHFYILNIGAHGSFTIYPGAANDSDGTQFAPVITVDNSQFPGCLDADFCHSPTFTEPRSGNPLSDTLDGTYGNHQQEIYFRIQLPTRPTPTPTTTVTNTPTQSPTPTTPTPTVQPTSTSTATPMPSRTPNATQTPQPPQPTPTPSPPASTFYSFEDGGTDGWTLDYPGSSSDSLQNSTNVASDGSHSLKTVIKNVNPDKHVLVVLNTWSSSSAPPMPGAGKTISAMVYVPANSPDATGSIVVEDTATNQFSQPHQTLQKGQWNRLSYTVPSDISGPIIEYGIGISFPNSSSQNLTAYIDGVSW